MTLGCLRYFSKCVRTHFYYKILPKEKQAARTFPRPALLPAFLWLFSIIYYFFKFYHPKVFRLLKSEYLIEASEQVSWLDIKAP